jgi:hypothetical protein
MTSTPEARLHRNAYLRQGVYDGEVGFYFYSFVETNDDGEALGVHGPFHDSSEYVEALERCFAAAGVSV